MARKSFPVLILTLCLLLLAGCGCQHEWKEATCSQPRTCAKCAETEGEPLEHEWREATCTQAKTCVLCGKQEGEPLPHTWLDATYEAPKTCVSCAATEGEPLTPDFEAYGISINLFENRHTIGQDENGPIYAYREPFDYVTACWKNPAFKTTGELYLSDYRIFVEDETHPAVPGYEWRAFDVEISYTDRNAQSYGIQDAGCCENYYSIASWDASGSDDTAGTPWERFAEEAELFTVRYRGEEWQCAIIEENPHYRGWKNVLKTNEAGVQAYIKEQIFYVSFYCCVPVGYDGVVIGFYDSSIDFPDDKHIYDVIDENTLLFRLNGLSEAWWEE